MCRAETKLSEMSWWKIEDHDPPYLRRAILNPSILDPPSSTLIANCQPGFSLFFHEFIGREFGIDLDLADLPLFVRRAAFDLGHAVRQIEAADALVITERPSVIDFRSFLESILDFFLGRSALFGSGFGALSRCPPCPSCPGCPACAP